MDSVKINNWICEEILHFPHPLHIKYEMFLDKGGKKISKSTGNVLTPQKVVKIFHTCSMYSFIVIQTNNWNKTHIPSTMFLH